MHAHVPYLRTAKGADAYRLLPGLGARRARAGRGRGTRILGGGVVCRVRPRAGTQKPNHSS